MNKINMSSYQPIADIQQNVVFANNGNVIICYKSDLPEIYSLSEKDFEDLHASWFQAVKSLPVGTVVHKQDVYLKKNYDSIQLPNSTFLEKATHWHFKGREYMEHRSYLFFIHTKNKALIAKYRDAGEVIGSTITGKIDTLIPVEINNKYKFNEQVSILIGPYTYSSAILFANTVQDFKFGKLIGEPTGGKSGQTGAIQFSKMPNSGLTMISPRFYLERPKGGRQKEPIKPDIRIEYDKLYPEELINILLLKK